MTKKLYKALRHQKEHTEQTNLEIYGTLGIPLGGQRLVDVPNRNSFVYVKLRDNQSEVIQAFNNQVATSYGLPVIVQRQGNRYIVLGVDTQRYQNIWNSNSPFLPRHGTSHSFNLAGGGGGDIAWMYSQQFMPMLVAPVSITGGWYVNIFPHTLLDINGSWKYVGNTGTSDLSIYSPTGSNAVMVLVYMDAVSGNPGVLVGSGSYFSNFLTGTADIYPHIPSPNLNRQMPLSAIRLDTGTSNIRWENIYDVRQWIQAVPTGSVGGGSSFAGLWGLDEGIPLGTGTSLNVVGAGATLTLSGTMFNLNVPGGGAGTDTIGFAGLYNGVPLGTGTSMNVVGGGATFSISGSMFNLNIPTPSLLLPIYNNGRFVVSGTGIRLDGNVEVNTTGTQAVAHFPITTYFRVGQPTTLSNPTGLYWIVPDQVYASGSLGIFINGHALIPGIDYIEQLWVSGTYQYLYMQPTGQYHLAHYGVPCSPQTQPSTGTFAGGMTDSNGDMLTDSNGTQIVDSQGN